MTGQLIKHPGKTQRDVKSGAAQRNHGNKLARAAWNNEMNTRRSQSTFPWHTCNGKRNRFEYTGKGGKRMVVTRVIDGSMR